MEQVTSREDMWAKAEAFVRTLSPRTDGATIVGLSGDLGAGKTTFTQGLAKAFGITDSIQSPTFVIMKSYDISQISNLKSQILFRRFVHIDAYRLESPEELERLGWHDLASDPNNIIFIEWPEKVAPLVLPNIMINFEHVSENERTINTDK